MWLKTEHVEGVALLVPGRPLMGGPDMERLQNAMEEQVGAGRRRIILDLDKVQIFTSLALRELVRLQNWAKQEGISFGLCNVDRILQTPAQFWIHGMFTVFDGREAGLRAFSGIDPTSQEVRRHQ